MANMWYFVWHRKLGHKRARDKLSKLILKDSNFSFAGEWGYPEFESDGDKDIAGFFLKCPLSS